MQQKNKQLMLLALVAILVGTAKITAAQTAATLVAVPPLAQVTQKKTAKVIFQNFTNNLKLSLQNTTPKQRLIGGITALGILTAIGVHSFRSVPKVIELNIDKLNASETYDVVITFKVPKKSIKDFYPADRKTLRKHLTILAPAPTSAAESAPQTLLAPTIKAVIVHQGGTLAYVEPIHKIHALHPLASSGPDVAFETITFEGRLTKDNICSLYADLKKNKSNLNLQLVPISAENTAEEQRLCTLFFGIASTFAKDANCSLSMKDSPWLYKTEIRGLGYNQFTTELWDQMTKALANVDQEILPRIQPKLMTLSLQDGEVLAQLPY